VLIQTEPWISCPIFTNMSAQQLPSRKIWDAMIWMPRLRALCHLFRSSKGTKEGFENIKIALDESLSNQTFRHPWLAACFIAGMKAKTSKWKTEATPMLQTKAPRKEPWESQKRPPQAAWPSITEPSVLTFNQGEVGAFQTTGIISFTVR